MLLLNVIILKEWVGIPEVFLHYHEYNLQDTKVLERIRQIPMIFQPILIYKIVLRNLRR